MENKARCAGVQELPKCVFSLALHSWVGAGGGTVPPWAAQTRVGTVNKEFRPTKSIKPQHLTRILEGFELASNQVLCNIKRIQLILNITPSRCGKAEKKLVMSRVLDLDHTPTSHTQTAFQKHGRSLAQIQLKHSNSA